MLKNYFKTAIRNLRRNRAFAIINILGLVLGISGTVVIYRIIAFENSFDRYHQAAEQTYRINLVRDAEGDVQRSVSVMHPLGPALRTDFPDWGISRIHWWGDGIYAVENAQGQVKKFKETLKKAFVEPDFLKMFDFNIIAGDPKNPLGDLNTMVISTTAADKLFDLNGSGYQSIIGRFVKFENKLTMQVTAVFEDAPANTDYDFHYLMFYEGAKIYPYASGLTNWRTRNGATRTWIKLPNGQTEEQAEMQLEEASKDYLANIGVTDDQTFFALEPLTSIHLDEETGNGDMINEGVIRVLKVIALILVITAVINFINLATAQSVKRAKEIGIRKVLGSNKGQLVLQFLGEVFLITLLSVVISLGVSEGALMQLEPILGYSLGLNLLSEPSILFFLLLIILGVTVLAGSYPAIVLANYNPVSAIKNSSLTSKTKSGGMIVRRILVVFQFWMSQTLIIGTLVVVYQLQYIQDKELGFETEGMLTFSVPDPNPEKIELLKNRLSVLPGAGEVSFYVGSPGAANSNNLDGIKDPRTDGEDTFTANRKNVDDNYGRLFDLKMLAGEFYRPESPSDYSVVNRKFTESLGFKTPDEAIGYRYETSWGAKFLITGVVEDFHNVSLRSELYPVFMMSGVNQYFEGGVKLTASNDFSSAISQVDEIWSSVFPEDVFDYQFLEDRVDAQYSGERKVSALAQVFAGLAIFIGCLGLYGLVSFMANQKVKEIGIRKVLGASIQGIIAIFSREVMILLGIAFLVAAPFGYYVMNGWLDSYAYSISLGFQVFLVAMAATVIIAAGTVGYRAFRAASVNPVQSLRDD